MIGTIAPSAVVVSASPTSTGVPMRPTAYSTPPAARPMTSDSAQPLAASRAGDPRTRSKSISIPARKNRNASPSCLKTLSMGLARPARARPARRRSRARARRRRSASRTRVGRSARRPAPAPRRRARPAGSRDRPPLAHRRSCQSSADEESTCRRPGGRDHTCPGGLCGGRVQRPRQRQAGAGHRREEGREADPDAQRPSRRRQARGQARRGGVPQPEARQGLPAPLEAADGAPESLQAAEREALQAEDPGQRLRLPAHARRDQAGDRRARAEPDPARSRR